MNGFSGREIERLGFALLIAAILLPVSFCCRADRIADDALQDAAYRIDPNRAEATELTLLPGIGPRLAEEIVKYRKEGEPFSSVGDLQRVKGIGPKGAANPFTIMTHSEDRQGASARSVMPVGYMTTTLEIHPRSKQILFHQGKTVGNDPDDRACRTKLCAEPVGDIEKLFTMWDRWGWHRVTFYGDLKKPVFALADAMGWKIVEEA